MARKAPQRQAATAPPVDRGRVSARRPIRNLVPSIDLFEPDDSLKLDDDDRREILRSKIADVTHFRVGLASLRQHALVAREIAPTVRPLPRVVRGVLRNPGGSPAVRVSIQPTLPGESAVLGRAVEGPAAVRSLTNPSEADVTDMIHRVIKGKVEDGQFSEAPVTMQELSRIEKSFIKTFVGMAHDRIRYPGE